MAKVMVKTMPEGPTFCGLECSVLMTLKLVSSWMVVLSVTYLLH